MCLSACLFKTFVLWPLHDHGLIVRQTPDAILQNGTELYLLQRFLNVIMACTDKLVVANLFQENFICLHTGDASVFAVLLWNMNFARFCMEHDLETSRIPG